MNKLDDVIDAMIDEITEIRSANNLNWMEILRIALRADPDQAMVILEAIIEKDSKVDLLAAGLVKKMKRKIDENSKPQHRI